MKEENNRNRTYNGETNGRGTPHGRGVMIYTTGSRYDGGWKNGRRHGRGVMIWKSGSRYDGEWEDGKRHGRGVQEYSNGRRYEGQWSVGYLHGKGVFYYTNGDRYVGDLEGGMFRGQGVFYYENGNRCEGDFIHMNKNRGGPLATKKSPLPINPFDKKRKPKPKLRPYDRERIFCRGKYYLANGKCLYEGGIIVDGRWHSANSKDQGTEFNSDGSVKRKGIWNHGEWFADSINTGPESKKFLKSTLWDDTAKSAKWEPGMGGYYDDPGNSLEDDSG